MKRALTLAEIGRGKVAPNPLVGAVIVYKNQIIGEGYHGYHGDKHAEINAINSVKDENLQYLKESIIYCNLEPCSDSYPGKINPPCCDKIIDIGFKKVVIGQLDPNPKVSGRGVRRLEEAGIEVELGLLEDEAIHLNRGFNSVMRQKRPFIHLKWAQTLDGQVATKDGVSKWISSEECRKETHYYRSLCDGIMVGTNTVIKDNPSLNARYGFEPSPRPVIIDRSLKLDSNLEVFKYNPLIITSKQYLDKDFKFSAIGLNGEKFSIEEILNKLPSAGINSLFVEGGANLITQFIEAGLWDQITVYIAPKILGEGISPVGLLDIRHPRESINFNKTEIKTIDDHIVFNGWK